MLRSFTLASMFAVSCNGEEPQTYAADWVGMQAFFGDQCAECHSDGAVVFPDAIRADVGDGTEQWVVPGDPEASRLWLLLTGDIQPGMPLANPLLPETIEHVHTWIADGAPL